MPTRLTSVVIDANDPAALARWWSAALGWLITYEAEDEVVAEAEDTDDAGGFALVFVPVPEPKATENRVHLDLASDSTEHQQAIVDRLVSAGAARVDVGQKDRPWVVLADPEGNEFCVLEPRDRHAGRGPLASIVVDAISAEHLAAFWTAAAGWSVRGRGPGWVSLENPSGELPDLDLVDVPDAKVVKNRWHLDVAPYADDDQAAAVDHLISLGARRIDIGQGERSWLVLADPEGNEFCVLSPR